MDKKIKALIAAAVMMMAGGAVAAAAVDTQPTAPAPIQSGATTDQWCPPICF